MFLSKSPESATSEHASLPNWGCICDILSLDIAPLGKADSTDKQSQEKSSDDEPEDNKAILRKEPYHVELNVKIFSLLKN